MVPSNKISVSFVVLLGCVLAVGTQCASEACSYAVRLLFIQEASAQYECDIKTIQSQLKSVFKGVKRRHPYSSFKLASFSDLPFFPFGNCASPSVPYESHGDWSTSAQEVSQRVADMKFYAYGDIKQAQLMAIANAVDVGEFDDLPQTTQDGTPIKNVIVLATDSDFHSKKSVLRYEKDKTLQDTCHKLGLYGSMEKKCCLFPFSKHTKMDWNSDGKIEVPHSSNRVYESFPSYDQIAKALKKIDGALIILKIQSEVTPQEVYRVDKNYQGMLDYCRYSDGIVSAKTNYKAGSGNLAKRMKKALASLDSQICASIQKRVVASSDERPPVTVT